MSDNKIIVGRIDDLQMSNMPKPDRLQEAHQYRIEVLIAENAALKAENERLRKLARREHYSCEDSWYSCPKSEEGCADDREIDCNCGADRINAQIEALKQAPEEQSGEAEESKWLR